MVRFFGKIFGTKADYVILEGAGKQGRLQAAACRSRRVRRQRRSRAWVSTGGLPVSSSACEEFVQLEDATPEQVLKSMAIRKYFTGDFERAGGVLSRLSGQGGCLPACADRPDRAGDDGAASG